MRWYLLTMQGFVTEQHMDASGYATWVQMLSGWKLWFIMRHKHSGHTSWRAFVSFQELATDMSPAELAQSFDISVLFLGPGTQLFVFNLGKRARADAFQLDAAMSVACGLYARQCHRYWGTLPRI
jgi:hypothetical protein